MAKRIVAHGTVPARAEDVFAFLRDLDNHWLLASRWIELIKLDGDGGHVKMRGPLGFSRVAKTEVIAMEEPKRIEGLAQVGPETSARVSWTVSPHNGRAESLVQLEAEVLAASHTDRLLLEAGGSIWLQHHFQTTINRLADRFAS